MEIYQVGGCVRDLLLRQAGFSVTTSDRDWVVVGATPEMMIKKGFIPVGKNFPVFLHPETHEEYALARTERKVAKGYHGFTFYAEPDVTLEEDLARRDLTINAIAMDVNGALIDPYHGQADIHAQCLRHVSAAFCEDPVRILRLARFSARFPSFRIAPETLKLCQKMVNDGEADALIAERVWKEMSRGFAETCPRAMLQVLADCGYWSRALPTITLTETCLSAVDRAARTHWDAQTRTTVIATIIFSTDPESACRLKVPSHIEQLIDLTHRQRKTLLTAIQANTAENWAHVFETCDVLRRRERFELFLKVCAILDGIDPSVTAQLVDAFCSVQPKTLELQGLSPQEIRQTILDARTAQIRTVLKA